MKSIPRTAYLIPALVFMIGFSFGLYGHINEPYDYRCANDSIAHNDCFADCGLDEETCLLSCGCTEVTKTRSNPFIRGVLGGTATLLLWGVIKTIKDDS